MIRTNGNRNRIGNVYQVTPAATGCAFSAFQIGLHFESKEISDFAYWMLRERRIQSLITENASGTTGLGNVAVKWLKALPIPWGTDSERREAMLLFHSLQAVAEGLQESLHRARLLRSGVLSELLSGDRLLDESYDKAVGW